MRTLKTIAAIHRAKIIDWMETNVDPEEDSQIDYTPDDDSKLKENSKIPALKNLEPAITKLLAAQRIRNIRESKFEGPLISEDDVPDYVSLIKQEILHRIKAMPYQVFEVGYLLSVVKKLLPHGKFGDWMSKYLPISKSTAINYIRIYKTCLGYPEILKYFKQSVLYKICAPSFPPDFRRFIFENIDGPLDVKNKELLELTVKWKNGEVTPKSPEVSNLLKNYRFLSEAKNYIDELKYIKNILKNSAKKFKVLNKSNDPHPYLSKEDNETDRRFYDIEKMILGLVGQIDSEIRQLESNQ